jgi:hypothetical protein
MQTFRDGNHGVVTSLVANPGNFPPPAANTSTKACFQAETKPIESRNSNFIKGTNWCVLHIYTLATTSTPLFSHLSTSHHSTSRAVILLPSLIPNCL